MNFLISLILTGLVITISTYLIPGTYVENFWWAIITGLVISAVNTSIGGILRFFTFPINWLTFGLISFIITILMIQLSDSLLQSKFEVNGFWNTALFAILVAVLEMIISSFRGSTK